MTNTPITINTTDSSRVLDTNIVDSNGNPVSGLSGYTFAWNFSDNGAILTPQPGGNSAVMSILPTGLAGTVTVTVTATKSGANTLTGTNTVIVQGPTPSSIVITLG